MTHPGRGGYATTGERVQTNDTTTNEPVEVQFGRTLRSAREASRLDRDECARALRLPLRIARKLEEGDYTGMEPVYLRNYLHTYGQYVGVPGDMLRKAIAVLAPQSDTPELVSTGGISHSRFLWQRYTTAATYVVLTAVIVVPLVWLGLQDGVTRKSTQLEAPSSVSVATQDPAAGGSMNVALSGSGASQPLASAVAATEPRQAGAAPADAANQPLMASMAPFSALDDTGVVQPLTPVQATPSAPPAASASLSSDAPQSTVQLAALTPPTTPAPTTAPDAQPAQVHTLQIALSKPCWVAITTADGTRLAYGLLQAGTTHTYRSSQPMHVTVGNSDGATVTLDGQAFDLAPYLHANVARFHIDGAANGTSTSKAG